MRLRFPRRTPQRVIGTGLALLCTLSGWALPTVAFAASKSKPASKTTGKAAPPTAANAVTAIPDLTGSGMDVTLDAATVAAWKTSGVTVTPEGSATLVDDGAAVHLPITSGYVEVHADRSFTPSYLLGSIEQYGSGLTLTGSAVSVAVTDLVVDLGQSMVYGTIGDSEDVPFFSIVRRSVDVKAARSTVHITGAKLDLTSTGAAELDALFHTTTIAADTLIGTAQITATGTITRYAYTSGVSEIPWLSGIATSVTFAADALAVLSQVGVTPSANGSAVYRARSQISFPITGGTAVVQPGRKGRSGYLQGVILQQGSGLTLTRGSTSVTITDLTVQPGRSRVYGSVNGGADNADLFVLRSAQLQATTEGGNLHIKGAALDLTIGAAALLNSVFGTTRFAVGAKLGQLTMVVSGS